MAACLYILLRAGQSAKDHYPLYHKQPRGNRSVGDSIYPYYDLLPSEASTDRAVILLVFSLACVAHIHPLYRGLGPIYDGRLQGHRHRVKARQYVGGR